MTSCPHLVNILSLLFTAPEHEIVNWSSNGLFRRRISRNFSTQLCAPLAGVLGRVVLGVGDGQRAGGGVRGRHGAAARAARAHDVLRGADPAQPTVSNF